MATKAERPKYRVERISPKHDVSNFISPKKELTEYLVEDALEDQANKISVTYLLISDGDEVIGYFTLLNDSIRTANVKAKDVLDGYNYSSIPALKIGRLSTKVGYEKRGLGTEMLVLSFSYMFKITRYSGCRIMLVDSKSDCPGFYEKFGFKRTSARRDRSIPMYMDGGTYLKELESEDDGR